MLSTSSTTTTSTTTTTQLPCNCLNGQAIEKSECVKLGGGVEKCQSCDKGFELSKKSTCLPPVCECNNGLPPKTFLDGCDKSGAKCASCNEFYEMDLKTHTCQRATCTCENGTAAKDTECTKSEEKCVSCDAYYELGKAKDN
jgi:hypothetical protein